MAVIVSMLRGVNVGPHNRIRMDALRALYASLGLRDVQTYVQSGNIVFRAGERGIAGLPKRIGDGIERAFGIRTSVIVRTPSDLRDAIARNPFAARAGIEPRKLLVMFLAEEPKPEARARALEIKADPEELRIEGRELYIYFPNGMARPKLSLPLVEKTLQTVGTGRNWNTVRKLLEIAGRLEASVG